MRIQQLDVVRGLAALSVAVSHITQHMTATALASAAGIFAYLFRQTLWANGGLHPGVIVFIVLSGFCIHLPVAQDGDLPSKPNFWSIYAKRRVLRIVPVFLLGCVLGILVSTPYGIREIALTCRAIVLGAFVPGEQIVGNDILDTVFIEMWLYASYPVTLFIFRKYGATVLVSIAVLIHFAALPMLLAGADPNWAGRNWYTFYLYWVIGMLSAEAAFRSRWEIPLWTLCGTFAAYMAFGHLFQMKGAHYLKSLFLAIWIGALLYDITKRRSRPWRIFVRLGEVSYTLYVIHFPLLMLWVTLLGLGTTLSQLAFLAFLGTLTVVFYVLVERPSHRLAQSFRLDQVTPVTGRI